MAVKLKELENVIEELNQEIVDPPITATKPSDMITEILKAATLIEPDDDISKEAIEVIKQLKKDKLKQEEKTKPKAKVKKETSKKETSKKTTKTKPKNVSKTNSKEKSCYGHVIGSMSAKIDDAISDKKNHDIKALCVKLSIKRSRFMGHIKHLINDKEISIKITDGKIKVGG